MATVAFDKVSKSFGDTIAVKDVSFDCRDGEFVVIVGPSGAGKSTTLNCLAGLEHPEHGTIYIDDRDVTMLSPQKRDVAMVFESYALYPQLTVYNNIAFPLRSPRYRQSEDEIKTRVNRVAKMLSIDMLLERLPRQLSQGQRQRVSLGRALVRTPKIFLFDEPISHLDAKLRNAMRRELKRIRAELQQTTLYVTHDYLEALSLADRVVVLFEGQVLQFDQPKLVYNQPAAVEVGRLFGDLPMMFFEGRIDEQHRFIPDGDSFSLEIQEDMVSAVSSSVEVVLGLRSTDVELVPYDQGDLQGCVYSVQNQFDAKLVTIEAYDRLLDIITPVDAHPREGDKAGIRVSPESCYLFDKETRRAI